MQLLRNQHQQLQPHWSRPEDLLRDRQEDQLEGQHQSRLQQDGKTQVSIN